MSKISVVISAYNEEKKIRRCLESIKWADEIIFVDNTSQDETPKIAAKYTNKVYIRPNNKMLNLNKNYGISKAEGDWVLYLDADEVVTPELRTEIQEVLKNPKPEISGYWISRRNIIFGKWIRHGIWWPDKQLRLFRAGSAKYPGVHVHEYIKCNGPTSELTASMDHYNYETINQYLSKFSNIYADNEVENLLASGYIYRWSDALKFPVSDFVKIYFAQHGYRDGLHGLVLALLQSFSSFVVFAKLWEKHQFPETEVPLEAVAAEINRNRKELSYWIYTSKISEAYSPIRKIFYKITRKLVA